MEPIFSLAALGTLAIRCRPAARRLARAGVAGAPI